MLSNYNTNYSKTVDQMILINRKGEIIDNDCYTLKITNGKHINTIHPFFECLTPLLYNNTFNDEYRFNCINIDLEEKNITIDLILKTFKDSENLLIIIHDLTKQYIANQKAAQVNNETKIQSEILAYKNELYISKENFKNTFITHFTHEIIIPIQEMKAQIEFLKNANLNQNQLHNLSVIESTNEKLDHMVNDILNISKIESGHITITEDKLNLREQIQSIIDFHTPKCISKGIKLNFKIANNCPKNIISDKFRLAQITNNLIGNAIKFTHSGSIDLHVKQLQKTKTTATLEFTLTDTGIGIEKEKIDLIFNSFYQANNKQRGIGLGLGLSIVKQLINVLGGEITVSSTIGEGSIFKITLPFKTIKAASTKKKIQNVKITTF